MTPLSLTRRHVLLLSGAAAITGFGVWRANSGPKFLGTELTVAEAHKATAAGDITLVDIRRPDEWQRTGIAQGANPLDMRREDFTQALLALVAGDRGAPIALMCARGVRSDRMSARLTEAGFTNIIDVPEGMLGSRAGPGWLGAGLPVTAYP